MAIFLIQLHTILLNRQWANVSESQRHPRMSHDGVFASKKCLHNWNIQSAPTHTYPHGKTTSWNIFSKSQPALFILFFPPASRVISIDSIKCRVYVNWTDGVVFLFLCPYTTPHSLLMDNYIKYNGLLMLNSWVRMEVWSIGLLIFCSYYPLLRIK